MTRKQKIIELRKQKYTFQKIGDIFGISRQRVHQIYNYYKIIKEHINNYKGGSGGRETVRERVRKRDSWTCQFCGKIWKNTERRFDVHHLDCDNKKSIQIDKMSEMNNMITLCHKCHFRLHKYLKVANKVINSYYLTKNRGMLK